jgi:hypothetical protein
MGVEGCAISRRKYGHPSDIGVELMLVKDREIVRLDVAQAYIDGTSDLHGGGAAGGVISAE